MKEISYYRTNPIPPVDKKYFQKLFVYSKGKVILDGVMRADVGSDVEASYRNLGYMIEINYDDDGYRAAIRARANKANDLLAEFKADLFSLHGFQVGDTKAEKAFRIAETECSGLEEIVDLYADLADLIK